MNRSRVLTQRIIAIVLAGIAVVGTVIALVLLSGSGDLYDTLAYTSLSVALALAGLLIVLRAPRNPIGWLMLAMGVENAIVEVFEGVGRHPALPGSDASAWAAASLTYLGIGLFPILLMLFPTGTLPSPKWRVPFWIALGSVPVSALAAAFSHTTQRTGSTGVNPIAVDGPVVDVLFYISQVGFLIGFVAAIASLIVRYRRAQSLERQQLKWVTFATGLLVLVAPFALAFYYVSVVVQVVTAIAALLLPIAIAIAVLRFRLYSIDRIISRAASYVIVTLFVGAAYALVVVSVTAIVPDLPAVGVAVATLTAAGLFLPVLRRVQRFVDRRFDREQYDAAKLVDEFGERLRSGQNPHAAGVDLISAVDRALQPTSIGLWTRTGAS